MLSRQDTLNAREYDQAIDEKPITEPIEDDESFYQNQSNTSQQQVDHFSEPTQSERVRQSPRRPKPKQRVIIPKPTAAVPELYDPETEDLESLNQFN